MWKVVLLFVISAFAQDIEAIKPIKPPEVLYPSKTDKEFEKKLEELRKELKLLELQAKVSQLKKKIREIESPPTRSQTQVLSQFQPKTPKEGSQTETKHQTEQKELEEIEKELKAIQGFFTGILEVNGKKVVFDKYGRRYTEGSLVFGLKILKIEDSEVVVKDRRGRTFRIPLSPVVKEVSGG